MCVDCRCDRVLRQSRHRRADFAQVCTSGQVAQQDMEVDPVAQAAQRDRQCRGIGCVHELADAAIRPWERPVEHGLDAGAESGVSDAEALRVATELVCASEVHPGIQRGGRPFPY